MPKLRSQLLLCAALLGFAGAAPAAVITGVDATTANPFVAFGVPGTVQIVFTVNYTEDAQPDFALSPEGVFVIDDGASLVEEVARVPRQLFHKIAPGIRAGVTRLVFRETVTVPPEAIEAAVQKGQTRLFYRRTFNFQNSSAPATAGVELRIGGGAASGALNIARVSLHFPDDSRDKILAENARSYVLADISFSGAGALEAFWEIADPGSTQGEPLFHTLRYVRRQLIGNDQQITLRSPDLPTLADGLYLLRLRINRPAQRDFVPPVIRYFVNPALRQRAEPRPIAVRTPVNGAVYGAQTRFEWAPLNGAQLYQIEFYPRTEPKLSDQIPAIGQPDYEAHEDAAEEGADRYPISGVMVTGSTTRASLSRLSLSHLPAGATYEWRVAAYGSDGQLIGASPLRALVIPAAAAPDANGKP